MKNKLLALGLCTITSTVLAGTMGPNEPQVPFVSTLSMGPTWAQAGRTQTIFLTPTIEKAYIANKPTSTMLDAGIFAGLRSTWSNSVSTHIGVAVNAAGHATLNGDIWDDGFPTFNNYTYQYSIRHQDVSLEGKLFVDPGYWVTPWVKASIGVGFNEAYGFMNLPRFYAALPSSNFQTQTTTSFTYTVGAGLQKALNNHWQVGVGYEFTDWGTSELKAAVDQTVGSGLKLDHLYTNGLLFNITYLA